jgi:hypothetical protein
MTMRMLIRTSALLTIFLVAIAGAEAEGVVFVEGCPVPCETFDEGACFEEWPSEPICNEHIEDVCEMVLAMHEPDCQRACQVASGLCIVDEDECPGEGWLYLECKFEITDAR